METEADTGLNTNKLVLVAFLFVLCYGIIFAMAEANSTIKEMVGGIPVLNIAFVLPGFSSPMFFAMPIAHMTIAHLIPIATAVFVSDTAGHISVIYIIRMK